MHGLNEDELKRNVMDKDTWLRFVYLVICGAAFYLTTLLLFAMAVLQFLAKLFSGAPFGRLTAFGTNLATYQEQLSRYLTFATDEIPFPFAAFPDVVTVSIPLSNDSKGL